jgi:hypothetical protein
LGKAAVDFSELYELADREFSVGLADEELVGRSFVEAKGVEGLARQIYCQQRAKELGSIEASAKVASIRAQIEAQEKRLRTRKEVNRWLWAASSFIAFLATLVFSWFALAAVREGSTFYPLAFLTLLSATFTVVSLVASRYHTDTE